MSAAVVVTTTAELRELIREELSAARADLPVVEPAILKGAQVAKKAGVSRTTVHRWRVEGCPAIRLSVDTWGYEWPQVLEWLKSRDQGAA